MKKSAPILLFSVVFLFSALFSSCKNDKEEIPVEEYAPYISAFTGGLVTPSSSIIIELAKEVENVEAGDEVKDKLFSFAPSLKGKTYWVNNKTIQFIPNEEALKNGQEYKGSFKLGKIMEVPKRLKDFNFSFYVEARNFNVQVYPLIINYDNPNQVSIAGAISFSDAVNLETVQKIVSVTTEDNQNLTVNLEKGQNPNYIHFSIDNIEKRPQPFYVYINVDGKGIDSEKTDKSEVLIPAADVFEVLSTELIYSPDFGIQVTFSDPISTTQDLKGLITLKETKNYTRQIDGNKVNLYFERGSLSGITVNLNEGLKNSVGKKLGKSYSETITIEHLKPQIELLSDGNILPNSKNLSLHFKAVSLKAVDLQIIEIFDDNVLMFLQTNTLSSASELKRSGRLVYKKHIRLDSDKSKDLLRWENYSIDLAGLIKQSPGAIYRIELAFRQEYSAYPCDGVELDDDAKEYIESNLTKVFTDAITEEETNYWDYPSSYYSNSNYNWYVYDWDERDNPCHPSYYMVSDRMVSTNVMMSDIGIVAKSNADNKLWIALNNIITTQPISNAYVFAYNYQLQIIASGKTDAEGFITLEPQGKPFIVMAEANGQKTYLRMVDGENNSLSRFDTGGKRIEKGLKGYIYGERGVWRPGDTLHLTFVLNDKEKRIPENHPVTFEVYNARGQFYNKQISTKGINGFYTFSLPTSADDPTGLWNAYIKIGSVSFHKSLRIETIKPNRLKVNFAIEEERINAAEKVIPATLTSSWLTGATANGLEAKVEMSLSKAGTRFKGYDNYIFNNPATNFSTYETEIFSGNLNSEGVAKFNMSIPQAQNAPGMLIATVISRVFEPGGDASIFTQTFPFSPFSSYVGVNLNQPEGKDIETDTDHHFDVVTVDADGKPVNRELEYKIYKVSWSWWWERSSESFSNYVNGSSYSPVALGKLTTSNGKGSFNFRLDYPNWGRYLVYVKDKQSGHATGGAVYIDWPSWRGRSDKSDPSNVKMLTFSMDKKSYEVGESATVIIPASSGATALVAMENGSTVLSRNWVKMAENGDTKYTFKVTKDMLPNFYVHITMLQPHSQTKNDLPIRMYGVLPVTITDKTTILEPQISMPDVLLPETEFTVKVSEKTGKPMTYTLAIVDDGLLDLTNFKTPNAWNEFYSREALGINTWDMYDYIIGAFTGKLGAIFSIGGDEEIGESSSKANRFKPVVKFIGPFELGKGKNETHKIKLPPYIGSVRTMVVAGQDGAYGKAEKTTPVRSPLMILSSLPRVVSTGEEITLPVNVFAMENSVNKVTVKVETANGLLKTTDNDKKNLSFTQPGDDMVYFAMKTGTQTGVEKVTITATGGGKTATETIEIDVRNPNPAIIMSDNKLMNAAETAEFSYKLTGTSNDDWVKMEVSRIPSVDISRRFDFLYNYQHYCSEQLTSRALPLLYISTFKDLSPGESASIKKNVEEAIKNLYGRQLANGGIVYWPGNSQATNWVTTYAGHFLLIAKEKGYNVNQGVIDRWKTFQKREAQNWTANKTGGYQTYESEHDQAYRLYTLALAGSAELGAMNRMKEMKDLSTQARWRLAAAYAINGKINAAEELIFNAPTTVKSYSGGYTYGSSYRDEAMILETLALMGRTEEAFKQAQLVSKNLSNESYFSTQSTAYSLLAMGKLAEKTSGSIDYSWTLNGKKQDDVKSTKAIYQVELSKKPAEGTISLTNNGTGVLYVNVVSKAKPIEDNLPAVENKIRLNVSYADLNGKAIDISNIRQGTDFIAEVKVTNISASESFTDMALTHIFPSGWEIFNERMTGSASATSDALTYQDIRDDRVLSYFDLDYRQTKTVRVRLQASYIGDYVLPAVQCEAMYDTSVQARTKAGRVKVSK